jgi:hypothetical protein
MNAVEAALRTTAADLDRRAAGWALVGGFAVSIRSEPRFTRDVDVAIAVPGDPEAETLVRSLMADGYAVLASVEQDAVNRLATARLAPPGSGGETGAIVDLLLPVPGSSRNSSRPRRPSRCCRDCSCGWPGPGT